MKWEEINGEAVCTCPPVCDGCDRVRTCLAAGMEPLPKKRADSANLKAAVRGKTFYHSDEAVMQELGSLRTKLAEVEQERDERDELRELVGMLDDALGKTEVALTAAQEESKRLKEEVDRLSEKAQQFADVAVDTMAELAAAQQSAQEQYRSRGGEANVD